MVKRIGLTGGIGSGKTTIAQILEAMSYPVYYSDERAKQLCNHDERIRNQLISLFGVDAYDQNELNRIFLSEQIFKNPSLRKQVNDIIHPVVREDFTLWSTNQSSSLVFNEAAILFETGAYKQFDAVILVCAPLRKRIERVMLRDLMDQESVERRIDSQWTDEQKRPLSSFCIENDGIQPILIQLENTLKVLES
jgi:dephospho-CoA kinase